MLIEGRLVSSERIVSSQVRIEGDRIVEVGPHLGIADRRFGDECLIFAGFGDIHIHARDDVSGRECYKEDLSTAAQEIGRAHV